MAKAPAKSPRVRFHADHDFTPDHRTIAFKAGAEVPAHGLLEVFAVDKVDDLEEAFRVHGVPAELVR